MAKKEQKSKSVLPWLAVIGIGLYLLYDANKSQGATTTTTPATSDTTGNNTTSTTTVIPTGVSNPAAGVALPSDNDVYRQLYDYSVPWRYAVDRMSTAERAALWIYIFCYIKKNLHLYSYSGSFPDGYYDPQLYATLAALSTKWNLQLFY